MTVDESLTELMPPVRIHQKNAEPITVISVQNVPENKGYMITQTAISSMGERTIQVVRIENASLVTLVKALEALLTMQSLLDTDE